MRSSVTGDWAATSMSGDAGFVPAQLGDVLLRVEFGAAAAELLGRQPRRVAVVELPVDARAPDEGRLHRGSRRRSDLEKAQRQIERIGLRCGIARTAGPVSEREVGEHEPGHADELDDVL